MTFDEWWKVCVIKSGLPKSGIDHIGLKALAKDAWCGGYIDGCKIMVKEVEKHGE